MRREGLPALVAVLACGVLMAAGAAWLRTARRHAGDPASRLPDEELVIGFRGDALAAQVQVLSRFPVYRELVGRRGVSETLRRELRWGAAVPSPWGAVAQSGPSALGFYRGGWIAVRPAGGGTPGPLPSAADEPWRLLASDGSLLPRPEVRRRGRSSTLPGEEVEIELRVQEWSKSLGGARAEWMPYLPPRATGRVRADRGGLRERWEIACGDGCFLDVLDGAGSAGTEARAWGAIPETAAAVAWFLLDPSRLPEAGKASGGGKPPQLLARLDQLERFLGFAVRRELASALQGPAIAALVESGGGSEPRLLLALDLADPERAKRALDRVAALGVLSGEVRERTYRGVSISSWGSSGRSRAIEPAAAVDSGLLLLALRRADIADAIDRLRAPAPAEKSAALRKELAALPRGAWKAASRSASLTAEWERLLGAAPTARSEGLTVAVLWKEAERWHLEGRGDAPAVTAEPVLPTLRKAYRSRF